MYGVLLSNFVFYSVKFALNKHCCSVIHIYGLKVGHDVYSSILLNCWFGNLHSSLELNYIGGRNRYRWSENHHHLYLLDWNPPVGPARSSSLSAQFLAAQISRIMSLPGVSSSVAVQLARIAVPWYIGRCI